MKKYLSRYMLLVLLIYALALSGCQSKPHQIIPNATVQSEPIQESLLESTLEDQSIFPNALLENFQMVLPDELTREHVSDTQDAFTKGGKHIGGVVLLNINAEYFDEYYKYTETIDRMLMDVMKTIDSSSLEWISSSSSLYALSELHIGSAGKDYVHYLIRGYSSCYDVWFDRKQLDYSAEESIMQSIQSSDISADLNKLPIDQYDYLKDDNGLIQFNLPDKLTQEETTATSCYFTCDGQIVGGYAKVPLSPGIKAESGFDEMVSVIQKVVMDKIDHSEFKHSYVRTPLLEVHFTNGDQDFVHHITSTNGTDYHDLWIDRSKMDIDTERELLNNLGIPMD